MVEGFDDLVEWRSRPSVTVKAAAVMVGAGFLVVEPSPSRCHDRHDRAFGLSRSHEDAKDTK
jgi:hypothetical protein